MEKGHTQHLLIFYILAAVLGNMVDFVYCPKLRLDPKLGDMFLTTAGVLEIARVQS